MRVQSASAICRLLTAVLLAALLVAPAAASQAQGANPETASGVIIITQLIDDTEGVATAAGIAPDLEFGTPNTGFTWATVPAGNPIVPGSTFSGYYYGNPRETYTGEEVDSVSVYGPLGWTINTIGNAPANTMSNGLAVGQAYQNPNTGSNTTNRAHIYWGWDDPSSGPAAYVNATTIITPTRTYSDGATGTGVYSATSTGGTYVRFDVTYNVAPSWSAYLCPGAHDAYAYCGMSGVSTDPNFFWAVMWSSGSYNGSQDLILRLIRPCRQPAVSVTKTGALLAATGSPGGAGTVKVRYCFTVRNATTTANGVDLASFRVTDSTIGYDSGNVAQTLTPGASAPQICTDYTHSVTWPSSGDVCVKNTSGASATGTTPAGWREITAGDAGSGFTTGTFTSAAATGGVGLQICASPLAITLASLNAVAQTAAIEVAWETVSEVGNAGFNLYRATSPDGPRIQLNSSLIPSQGPGSQTGYSYSYLDAADLVPGTTYTYWLEDVTLTGGTAQHAPVSVLFSGSPTALRLSRLRATAAAPLGLAFAAAGILLAGAALRRRRS